MRKLNLLIALILGVFALSFLVSAQSYQVNYTNSAQTSQPNLVVQVLKYDPYPVNAGDWFDLWIKVQNIGQNSAPNVRFALVPGYPFSSNDTLVRDYGIIYGTAGAYNVNQGVDASQVILKYRVKVENSAPEGTSNINFKINANALDPTSLDVQNNLPISIGKTKTDFDVVMQDSTSQGTSFAIANIGENTATAVTVRLKADPGVKITGAQSSIVGNLAQGDFTTITFQIKPNTELQNVVIEIDYTDTVGVRNTIEKTVPVVINPNFGQTATTSRSSSGLAWYLYVIVGIIIGVLLVFVYRKIRKR
jgi:hypothetical protein